MDFSKSRAEAAKLIALLEGHGSESEEAKKFLAEAPVEPEGFQKILFMIRETLREAV